MIAKLLKWIFGDINIRPVHVDGLLYVSIALFGFEQAFLTNDDVYKYINAYVIFYTKWLVGSFAAIVGALKMYRSNTYAEHLKEKEKKTGNTDFFPKPPEPPKTP